MRIAGGGDGGKYFVYMTNIIESLKHRTLHSIISERYNRDEKAKDGYRNARICKVSHDWWIIGRVTSMICYAL